VTTCAICPPVLTDVPTDRHTGHMSPTSRRPRAKPRSVKVTDPLWDAAMAKAVERGEYLSEVIREALERYVRSKP
jgi:hypothetical protein